MIALKIVVASVLMFVLVYAIDWLFFGRNGE